MLRFNWTFESASSKDARHTAPSTNCAHNSANVFNNVAITGIAAAVSVFLLFVGIIISIISIISSAIIIHSIMIIMAVYIMYAIIMLGLKNLNTNAKLCKTQF